MTVGAHQREVAFIKRLDGGIGKGDGLERHGAGSGGLRQLCSVRRINAEAQQDETAAEQVEHRASVRQYGMGRAAAGTGARNVFAGIVRCRRRAVRLADRRRIVAVAERDAVGGELARLDFQDAGADFFAQLPARFGLVVNGGGVGQGLAVKILGRLADVA